MIIDPIAVVHQYLNPRLGGVVTGDLVGRDIGQTMVYLEAAGGYRQVRDRMDRQDVTYRVYAKERSAALELAGRVRELVLEDLPGRVVGGVQVLDVDELHTPRYMPDIMSREHVYQGEFVLFLTQA